MNSVTKYSFNIIIIYTSDRHFKQLPSLIECDLNSRYRCPSSDLCLDWSTWCDGEYDCPDEDWGYDEQNCTAVDGKWLA